MLTLIENGEIYVPEPRGRQPVLLIGDRIAKMGDIDAVRAGALGLPLEVIDASGCIVTPGLIDPHEHLTGGSGEEGFASRTPALQLSEIASWGITTVVGCLGVDATTRTLTALLARVKGLSEEGLTAFLYTGHYGMPPVTFTGSVREDLIVVAEVIGVGEIAVSDHRAPQATARELERIVVESHVGGMLAGKAGVTHFHVGEGKRRMKVLFELLDDYEVEPALLYPTHVHRTPELLPEAAELSRRGVTVDMDAAQPDLGRSIRDFLDLGGEAERLTLSSDADSSAPRQLFEAFREAVQKFGLPLARVLPMVTANTARVLKLAGKGKIEPGADADVLVLRRDSLEIVEVIARGRRLVSGGRPGAREKSMETSDRELHLVGQQGG